MAKNLLYIQQLLHILTCFLNCLGGKLSFVYGCLFCLFISVKRYNHNYFCHFSEYLVNVNINFILL